MYMVFPYMDHDLTGLLECPDITFTIPQVKLYMKQLLAGLKYLHYVRILHRDIKGANLLINNSGELKITDFGLARPIEEQRVHYTPGVVTRWYRPPELLFGATKYSTAVDLWGAGCILGEMLTKKPLLPGESDLHQLDLISRLCGTPTEETMPGCSELPDFDKVKLAVHKRRVLDTFVRIDVQAADLIAQLLQLDPKKRLTAAEALNHSFFKQPPLAMLPSDCPTYPSKHEFTAARHAPHATPMKHGVPSFDEEKKEKEDRPKDERPKDSERPNESTKDEERPRDEQSRKRSPSRTRSRSRDHHRSHRYPPRPYHGHPSDRFYHDRPVYPYDEPRHHSGYPDFPRHRYPDRDYRHPDDRQSAYRQDNRSRIDSRPDPRVESRPDSRRARHPVRYDDIEHCPEETSIEEFYKFESDKKLEK